MSKFLVETHYTCTFKIVHELDELNEKALSEVDSRKMESRNRKCHC